MSQPISILGFDYVEFYVGSAKMTAYWYCQALGFDLISYKGPETGCKSHCSYHLRQNDIDIVLSSALAPGSHESSRFVDLHGDGVKRFAYRVKDLEAAFAQSLENGGIPIQNPVELKNDQGQVVQAALKIYDDTELVLIDRSAYSGLFIPGFSTPRQNWNLPRKNTGLLKIDHIVGNVRRHEMANWANYFVKTFGFEEFIDFGPGDISTKYSALLSKVVRSKDTVIRNPINEPFDGLKKSQIEEYLDVYHGSGVQHIAIECEDILKSIAALRENGVEFLSVPKTYYENLKANGVAKRITEDIDALAELGILCDTEDVLGGEGYLLQLFTKPIGDRPSFFYEIIQRRRGSEGFGQGNFQALFEAIERDQADRGNL